MHVKDLIVNYIYIKYVFYLTCTEIITEAVTVFISVMVSLQVYTFNSTVIVGLIYIIQVWMRIVYVFLEPSPKPHVRSTIKDQEPVYDQNTSYPSNPFDEADTEMDSSQHGNPFDEPEPEPQPKVSPPRSSKRKNVRPVDMSKYLYANTTKTEEEELDE